MKMVNLSISDMSDDQLDYAAAVIQGWESIGGNWVKGGSIMCGPANEYHPSKDWRQLGGLISFVSAALSRSFDISSEMPLYTTLLEYIYASSNTGSKIAVPATKKKDSNDDQ